MSIYDFKMKDIDGNDVDFATLKGKVLLIVNIATKSKFSEQLVELDELYRKFNKEGLEILAFPCNQFFNECPGTEDEIKDYCELKYGIIFKLMQKIDVNGANEHPLYTFLKDAKHSKLVFEDIKLNFVKFLVDRAGEVVSRDGPIIAPKAMKLKIDILLKKTY